MIHGLFTSLPIIFQVEEGASSRILQHITRNKLSFDRIVIFCGGNFSLGVAKRIAADIHSDILLVNNNTLAEAEKLVDQVRLNRFDCIIAVGGGRVLDIAKLVSLRSRVNHISVPTIISNDGLISPITVVKDDHGRTHSLAGQAPLGVIVDINIILASPRKYLQAAAGDVLSNLSATNDWSLSCSDTGEAIYDIAFQMSRSAANSLIYSSRLEFDFIPFIRQLVQAQVNSGIAMSIAGTSRPCSGSEHLLSHAIDFDNLGSELHGVQVGSLSLFTLHLQSALKREHIRYAQTLNIPLILPVLQRMSAIELRRLLARAKEMRTSRYTILNRLCESSFVDAVEKFKYEITQLN